MTIKDEKSPRSSSKILWPLRFVLAAIVTLAGIQYSFRHSRLLWRPMADDANYLVDGILRLRVLYHDGWLGLIHSFVFDPPHAPFSSLLAMGSFAFLGIHDWAPYAGNGIIILVLLVMVDRLLGSAPLWQRLLAYLLVLTTRLPMTAIVQFRPDVAVGIMRAFTVLMISNESLLTSPMKWRATIGILIGLTLLIKPSMAPINAIILAAVILWQIPGHSPRLIIRQLLPVALFAVVVCLPYYLFGTGVTVRFIYDNVFGARRELWEYDASWLKQFTYFLDGPGSDFLLGTTHTFLLITLFIVGISLNYRSAAKEGRRRLYGFAFVTFVAYLLPSIFKHKNGYSGSPFQCILLLGAVAGLRQLFKNGSKPARALALLTCLASLLLFQWPLSMGDASTAAPSNQLLTQVYTQLQSAHPGDRIFIPAPGKSVSWNTLNYLSLTDDSLLRFFSVDFGKWNDQSLLNSELDQADWIILGDEGNEEARMDVPNNKSGLPIYMAAVNSRPEFTQTASFPAYASSEYHIFHRTTPPFTGFDSVDNQTAPTHIRFTLPTAGRRVIILSFAGAVPNQEVSAYLNNQLLAQQPCDNEGDYTDIRLDLNLPAGNADLELQYKTHDPTSAQKPPATFKKIQVLSEP